MKTNFKFEFLILRMLLLKSSSYILRRSLKHDEISKNVLNYEVISNKIWRFRQILVAASEQMIFTQIESKL